MNNLKKIVSAICLALTIFLIGNQAQTKQPPKSITSGVVNGKAVFLPKPEYPVEVQKAGLTGTVNVLVTIDETGKVISAKTISGIENAALRKTAEEAALKAEFLPTTLAGKPVRVTGTIIYSFTKNVSNEEKLKIIELSSFLFSLKYFANNLKSFNRIFLSDDIIEQIIEKFSSISPEVSRLNTLKNLSAIERVAKIDEIILATKTNLKDSDQWQFQMGEPFAVLLSQLFATRMTDEIDLSRFNENAVKKSLGQVSNLLATAPDDFPKDVLAKMNELSDLHNRETFLTEETLEEFFSKTMNLLETISPN